MSILMIGGNNGVGIFRKGKTPFSDKIEEVEAQVSSACEFLGYGRVMDIACTGWMEKADSEGRPGEGLVIGPHKGSTVECGCSPEERCDWCAGSGWLTKKVKRLKDSKKS